LIKLLRRVHSIAPAGPEKTECVNPIHRRDELLVKISDYMRSNLSRNLTFDEISETFYMSKTRLKILFKETMGIGMMQYFNLMKIEEAKSIIREQAYNYTEIAERLGYSSIHYFSSRFKKATGMPPTEYARTMRSKHRPAGSIGS
jgi:YesN/AraC family two-component response regulator